jgi:signal transduction histidine kinase
MGEMIGMIAHQWRQPLSAISATISTLQVQHVLRGIDQEELAKELESIEALTQHLSKTINDFRDFFKEEKEKKAVRLHKLVEDSVSIINAIFVAKNITLNTENLCEEEIITYPNEIKQVILNILKNAQDILEERKIENPVVTIKTFVQDEKYCISIEDNAGGIPDEIIDRIFEPYFSTKDSYNGTGLGLYMSKTIIQDHCMGTIEASNTATGALFVICMKKSVD